MSVYLEDETEVRRGTHAPSAAWQGEGGLAQMLDDDRRRRHEAERSAGMDHTAGVLLPLALRR